MKVLHIIANLRKGGAERIALDIVRELNRRSGITVRLVLLEDKIEYNISDVRELVHVIPSSVMLSVWRRTRYDLDRLQAFVDEYRPDVIHSHLFIPELVSRSLEYEGARWFSHCHWNTRELKRPSLIPVCRQDIIDWRVYRYMLHRYQRYDNQFIAISQNVYEFYISNLPALKENIHYLPNAVNLAAFRRPASAPLPPRYPIRLISIGTLNEGKNQALQIEIARVLHSRGIAFHLDICGDGPMRNQLSARVESLGLSQYVSILGAVSDVQARLAESTIFLHTSLAEGFGLVLIEAMAAGLPVISLDGGGNAELMHNGTNGYLLNIQDPEAFADKIILASTPDQYTRLSEGALMICQQYDIAPYVSKLLDLYAR
ncbi:MAG: glycosyltransferase [Bacteroidetes bacterium]|nr:glycosyltransferase [Bacteroidota bacterium]